MLKQSRPLNLALVLILVVQAALLIWMAYLDSPTYDEVGHLAAGISHWEFANFDLFRVNPPLVRLVAGLPAATAGIESGWRGAPSPTARLDFRVGQALFKNNGDRAFRYLTYGRWACIPFTLLGGIVCWLWAGELYGRAASLIALLLWCICPNVLGHGHLITPDVGAASLGVTAGYTFWRWLRTADWLTALTAGGCLGLAELTKSTWIVLFAMWPVLWLLWTYTRRQQQSSRWRQAGQLCCILLLAVYVLNLGYAFEGTFTRLGDFQFVSSALAGDADASAPRYGNRFDGRFLGQLPVPVPKDYLLGIDRQKWQFELPDNSYLRGQWSSRGWYHYYLYAVLVKVPLGTLLLIALTTAVLFIARVGARAAPRLWKAGSPWLRTAHWCDDLILLAPAAIIFGLVSSQTGFNRHLRYVLPAFPFVFIWASQLGAIADFGWPARCARRAIGKIVHAVGHAPARRLESGVSPGPLVAAAPSPTTASCATPAVGARPGSRLLAVVLLLLLSTSALSSLLVYPHSLSYFNELVGGPKHGHWHLQSSNVDWGQDLFRIKQWHDEHCEARPFHLVYSLPLVHPEQVGLKYQPVPAGPVMNRPGAAKTCHWPWGEARSTEPGPARPPQLAPEVAGPRPGWFAVSVSILHDRSGAYEYFTEFEPVDWIGYTTPVYHITLEEANRLRRKLKLPLLPESSKDQG